MNLPKAIEILSWRGDQGNLCIDQDFYDALKLGVEALARLQVMRSYNIEQAVMPLPTEKKG